MGVTCYPRTARLVNRFKLGADPEFVFLTPSGTYQYAENLGLTTREAFGCDMAGRQAEIRATPSRFALEVVGSIMDSLRWMSEAIPATQGMFWSATAYNGKDGCGGHVHFGRRLPRRWLDLVTMDSVCQSLVTSGVFNATNFFARTHHTHYGHYGDFRLQPHGFEYRTLPTSLSSPWLCYFVLVLSKLAVYEGVQFPPKMKQADFAEYVIKLLQKYQDTDDDAAIALRAVRLHGFPNDMEDDFKARWGVRTVPVALRKAYFDVSTTFFPSMIEPEPQTCQELFDWLTRGLTLPLRKLQKATWEPFAVPKGFHKIGVRAHTLGHLPDIGMNLLSKGVEVQIVIADTLTISTSIKLPVLEIQKALSAKNMHADMISREIPTIQIGIPQAVNKEGALCKFLHSVLSNPELFPICKAHRIQSVDWSRWEPLVLRHKRHLVGRQVSRIVGKAVPESSVLEEKKPLEAYNLQVDNQALWGLGGHQHAGVELDIPALIPRRRRRLVNED